MVPAGTYIRPELHTTKNNAYSKTFEFSSTATDNFIYNFTNDGGWANWATTFFARSAYVYFDNTNSQWTNDYKEIMIGRDGTSDTYNMTLIPNTNNLYCYTSGLTYNDFTQFCFIGNSSHWGQYADSPNNRKGSATTNTDNYQVNMDHSSRQYNLFIPAGTTKGTSLTHNAYGDYTSLNYTQTVEQKLSENGGDSYSTSTRALATVSVNSYKLNSATGTTADGGSIASGQSSKSCDAARTATVTYSVSSIAEGYTFVGWYDGDTEKSTSTTYTYQATEAKTITARFKANAYSVVFKGNDNTSGSMSNQTFYYNVAQNLTTNAYSKNGYSFGGWTTNNDGTGTSYTNGQSVSNWSSTDGASITIYAKWTQDITLDRESGTSGSTSVTATYNSATLGSYDNPERSGYTFGGYYSGDDGTGELIINTSKALQANKTDNDDVYTGASGIWKHAGATTLHAQWTAKDYTINLANMEATTPGTTSVGVTFDASTNMTASDPIDKPTKTHYDFGGYWTSENTGETLDHQLIGADGKWIADVEGYTSKDGAGNPTWVHDYPISLYAKWTEHEYTITTAVSPVGAGSISCGSSTTAKYVTASGDITATPSTGYSFREWGFSETGTGNYDVYVSDGSTYSSTDATIRIKAQRDGTLTANFTANGYTVTLENNDADEGHKGTENVSVTYNATTGLTDAITKPEKLHYDFGGYYVSNDGGETLTNIQLIDANGNWNKGVSGYTGTSGDDATWVYAGNITLYAKWTEHEYTITTAVSPVGTGSISCGSSTTAKYVTASGDITATANPGYTFRDWGFSKVGEEDYDVYVSDGSTYSSTDATIRIKAQRDGTLTANFNANNYTVTLEDRGADEGHKGTPNVSVTYNATTNLTSAITTPEKTYYTFGGYYTSADEGETLETQLIDASGNWQKSVTGYTGASGDNPTWVYVGNITLYAKWTETKHTVTVVVSPSSPYKTGSVTISGSEVTEVSVGKIIPTADMTAEPANAAFKFKEWQLSEHVSRDEARYTANANPNSFFAEDDGQITAVFQTRFGVIGSLKSSDAAGHGMPGWVWSNAVGFDVNGFTDFGEGTGKGVDFRYSTTLDPNTQYKFRIYDRIKNEAIGCAAEDVLPAEDGGGKYKNWKLSHTDDGHDVLINTTGRGTYTFHITYISDDGNYWPSIQVDRPTAYQLNLGWGYVETEDLTTVKSGNVGGTVTAVATEGGVENAIANSEWVIEGGSITITPHPADDYVFAGWFTSSDYSQEFGDKLNPLPINSISATVNVYAKFVEKSTIFEGDVVGHEKEWNNTENWSTGALPTINDVAIITKPVIVDITDARAKRVIIDQSSSRTGQIEIAAGKELVVAGTVRKTTNGSTYVATDEEDIVFDSSSSLGLGALVMGSHDGTNGATVNFYSKSHGSTGSSASVNQYVGTPFNDATVLSDWYNSWMYQIGLDELGNITWKRIGGNTPLNPFQGYCVISADNEMNPGHMYWMQGQLVSSEEQNKGLVLRETAGESDIMYNNENMLANSWMAPIKIGAFQLSDFINTNATIYIFNSGSPDNYNTDAWTGAGPAQYSTYPINSAGNAVIPAMQAFSVFPWGTLGEGTQSIKLNYERLVYTPAVDGTTPAANRAPQRRVLGEETNKMHLYVHGESGYGDMVYLLSRSDFENGFENGWDGHKLFGESVAPQMYAITPDGNMAINCVPTMEGTVLGFQKGSGDSEYAFSFDYEGLETLYLNDLKAQVSTLIDATNIYTFTAAADDDEARFIISATPIGQMPTEVETPSGSPSRGEKILINGQLYIIRHGRMYSAEGCLIK